MRHVIDLQPLLLAAPDLLTICEELLAEESAVLEKRQAGPYAGDGYCAQLERRIARLREVVERAGGDVPPLPKAPPEVPTRGVHMDSWLDAAGVVAMLAATEVVVVLVEDARVRGLIEHLDTLLPDNSGIRSTVETGDAAILTFKAHPRNVLVLPFHAYFAGVDLSFAAVGVIVVSAATSADESKMRQARGRFCRVGGSVRAIRVLVVAEAP